MNNSGSYRLTFLGTGTSMGVPVAGGFDRHRISDDPKNERMRCSAWLQTKESSILIDVSPEFRIQSIRSSIPKVDLVLITHEHMDHIAGLDDLRAYNFAQQSPIPLFTSCRTADSIRTRFDYMFGDDRYPGATEIEMEAIDERRKFRDLTITPLPVHHGSLEILGFRIGNLCYMTDTKRVPESTKQLINGCHTLIVSGLRWKPDHPTHMTIPEAITLSKEVSASNTYLIHMNSQVEHGDTEKRLPDTIHLAYDQLTIEIPCPQEGRLT